MIVRLNHTQGRAVIDFIGGLHADMMVEHRVPYGRKQHDYLLPAIGWRQILDRMQDAAYGPLGGRRKDRSKSFHTAMSRMQDVVSRREHHPALRRAGVLGVETELIPSWWTTGHVSSPYPEPDGVFELLAPRSSEVSGHVITDWAPADVVDHRFPLHPDHHHHFVT